MTNCEKKIVDELVLIPSLKAVRGPNGGLILTQKFLNGVAMFAAQWPGRVSALLELTEELTSDMDHVEAQPSQFDFSLEVIPCTTALLANRLSDVSVVLGFLSPDHRWVAEACRAQGVPLVLTTEYTPKTECQIIDAEIANSLRRLRRKLRVLFAEKHRIRLARTIAGIQCNGTPTYDRYSSLNANTLLFFDNRVPLRSVISPDLLDERLEHLRLGKRLRLIYGGRLIGMKGVLQLPLVASALKRAGLDFSLEIYGSGPLEHRLFENVRQLGLATHVRLGGVLDFEKGWLPLLRERTDLFICCHPQGDPSSTYTEVMSCGVPIVGYANEAFSGVAARSRCGWLVPVNSPTAMADAIVRLASARPEIAAASIGARKFAAAHAFEPTFAARTRHLFSSSRHAEKSVAGKERVANEVAALG